MITEILWQRTGERLPEAFLSVLLYVPMEAPLPTVFEGFVDDFGRFHSIRGVITALRTSRSGQNCRTRRKDHKKTILPALAKWGRQKREADRNEAFGRDGHACNPGGGAAG